MSWLMEKSPAWRRIVHVTRSSGPAMAAFTAVCFGGAALLGAGVMTATSTTRQQALEEKLRARAGVNSQVMTRVNKERLQVLLDDVKGGGGQMSEDRYAASLDGQTIGTTDGTTRGNAGIKRA